MTSRVLWTGHVMLAWVTLPRCLKRIQNRGFKPAMVGDLRPAKPGCSLVPHRAENHSTEAAGREHQVQRDGTASDVFGVHRIYATSPRTPKLVNCSRCGCLVSRVCTELSAWGCSSCTAARGMPASLLVGSQFWELYASSSVSSSIML